MRALLVASLVAVAGCDYVAEKILPSVRGNEINLVVLSAGEIVLSDHPISLNSTQTMKVLGENTMVCAVLTDSVPLQSQPDMDKAVPLPKPAQVWSRAGKVLPKGELSVCATPDCDVSLSPG